MHDLATTNESARRARAACGVLVAAVAVIACGCRTTSSTHASSPSRVEATRSVATRTWELRDGSEVLGRVVRMESVDAPEHTFFVVQNREGQDLGIVDDLGRAWRYRVHERDPEWIATGTVLQGARAILEAGAHAELVEVGLASPAASERDGA